MEEGATWRQRPSISTGSESPRYALFDGRAMASINKKLVIAILLKIKMRPCHRKIELAILCATRRSFTKEMGDVWIYWCG